ncbi:Thiol-disulfide isomerase [Labilithrix luteola]|uniref:Thiol-disulfide isomerase n=1 Tax=Labilithrix luteola TaxID=1391654 RepID=A0A0K1Q2G6_9BACT|nr:hypothetical protein [Labilithrix luteola]AKV00006.1 Thiol-disulfide isomerase [Labilithrix luteola]
MKTSLIATGVLVAFLSSTVPHVAHAEDDPVTTQARARFKEGVDFYDKGQFENARLAFLQAYMLKKHPAVLLNLAQSSAKSGHPLEASKYFQQYLKEATTATPAQRADAESGLAEVQKKIGRIEIVAPAGTDITLDDKDRLGTSPISEPIDVEPGPHTLKSSTETIRVTATAGQKVQARFGGGTTVAAVTPVPTPPTEPTPEPAAAPQPAEQPIVSESTAKHTNLLAPPKNMTPVYVGLGVGGVGLVSAIVFAAFRADAQTKADTVADQIRSAAKASNLDPGGLCNDPRQQTRFGGACATLRDNNDKVDTNTIIANVSLVVMGAGLLTAAGWYLFAPKKGEPKTEGAAPATAMRPTVQVTPYGGAGQGGLTVFGSF